MGFFDDNHVMQAGLQGSAGPEVGLFDSIRQGFSQQYHVDSAMGLQNELGNRWEDSLAALRASGQNFDIPFDSQTYLRYAQFIHGGAPVTTADDSPSDAHYGTTPASEDFDNLRRANEAIRQLHNPQIKTFEQILDEVSAMQRDTEARSTSMAERSGASGTIGTMLGSMAGSFTIRDPLNLATAPLGAGRTILARIASDVAINAGVTAITDVGQVNPNREIVGLPDRNPLYDAAAAGIGAGLLRGALIEPIAHGFGRLRAIGNDINLDFRDAQMSQMFEANDHSPTARAAQSILGDVQVFEHSNPYGDGHVAGYRWEAELDGAARALNGEPEPTLELPPLPSDQIERSLSFQSVKETAPELWNELEAARTKLNELDGNIEEATSRELTIPDAVRLVDEQAGTKLDQLSQVVNDESLPEPVRAAADMEARTTVLQVGQDKIMKAVEAADTKRKFEVQNLRASRKAANKAYRTAYQKVEAEATRLEHAEVIKRSEAQVQSIHVLGPDITHEPMTGPLTRFDFVEAHGEKVAKAETELPAKEEAVDELKITFGKLDVIGKDELHKLAAVGDGVDMAKAGEILRKASNEALARGDTVTIYADGKPIEITQPELKDAKGQSWGVMFILTDHTGGNRLEIRHGGAVDIGSKTPVSADFKVPFDEGEMSVKDVLADLAEDKRLEEAVRSCSI